MEDRETNTAKEAAGQMGWLLDSEHEWLSGKGHLLGDWVACDSRSSFHNTCVRCGGVVTVSILRHETAGGDERFYIHLDPQMSPTGCSAGPGAPAAADSLDGLFVDIPASDPLLPSQPY